MKCLLFLIILLFSFQTFSQLQLFQGNIPINNGDTITQIHYGPEMIVELFTDIDVKNNMIFELTLFYVLTNKK